VATIWWDSFPAAMSARITPKTLPASSTSRGEVRQLGGLRRSPKRVVVGQHHPQGCTAAWNVRPSVAGGVSAEVGIELANVPESSQGNHFRRDLV